MATRLFKIGPGATDTYTDLISLYGGTGGSGNYQTPESPGAVDYQVPTGKVLVITRIAWTTDTANAGIYIGYGDNGVADGAVAPTNFLYMDTSPRSSTANHTQVYDCALRVPAGKYPCLYQVGAGIRYAQLTGILLDA